MIEENKAQAWFMNGPAWYVGTCPKWTATSTKPYSVALKDSGEKKIPAIGRTLSDASGHIHWIKEYMDLWTISL